MSVAETPPPNGPFTDFERDPEARIGIHFEDFITAVAMFVYTNEAGGYEVSVADIAMAFNTTPDCVREAVKEHPWLYSEHNDDPTKQLIESDGE